MKLFCKAIIATLFAAATAKRLGETSFSRKLVENVPEAKSIPHKYHVIFDDSVSDVAAKVADINVSQLHFSDAECSLIDGSGAANATITRYYESVFKGMAVANMTNGLLQALERDPQVISIHQVRAPLEWNHNNSFCCTQLKLAITLHPPYSHFRMLKQDSFIGSKMLIPK
jgi:hypothetical protein